MLGIFNTRKLDTGIYMIHENNRQELTYMHNSFTVFINTNRCILTCKYMTLTVLIICIPNII